MRWKPARFSEVYQLLENYQRAFIQVTFFQLPEAAAVFTYFRGGFYFPRCFYFFIFLSRDTFFSFIYLLMFCIESAKSCNVSFSCYYLEEEKKPDLLVIGADSGLCWLQAAIPNGDMIWINQPSCGVS